MRVRLASTPARWTWQDWAALSNSSENLNRIGGNPCWIQSADLPRCRDCAATMRFVMQLDSDLPTEGGGEWLWGRRLAKEEKGKPRRGHRGDGAPGLSGDD